MLLFILALTSLASGGSLPCREPAANCRPTSECPDGQIFDGEQCSGYFKLRSEGKTCLFVPTNEVLCRLGEGSFECSYLYRALTAFVFAPLSSPPREEYVPPGEDDMSVGLTHGVPDNRFTYNYRSVYPKSVPSRMCPEGYYTTGSGQCIVVGNGVGYRPETEFFASADKTTTFKHGNNVEGTKSVNFLDYFRNTERVPIYAA